MAIFKATGQIITSFMWVGLPAGAAYFIAKENRCFLSAFKNCIKYFAPVFFSITLVIYLMPISDIPKINVFGSYIPRLLIFVLFLSFFNIFQLLTLSLKKYLYYNLFTFGLGVVICIFSVLVNLIPQSLSKLDFAIAVYIMSYGVMFIYGATLFFLQGNKLKIGGKPLPFFEQFKVGIRNFVSNLAGLLSFRLDLFLIGFFLTFKEVGIYSVALFSAEKIIKVTGSKSSIVYKPLPQDDPVQRQPDISLAEKRLNWQPHTDLDKGLENCIHYFKRLLGGTAKKRQPSRYVIQDITDRRLEFDSQVTNIR